MISQKNKPGFKYFVEDEARRRYAHLKPAEKMKWLSDAADFVEKASTPKSREISRKFRKAKI